MDYNNPFGGYEVNTFAGNSGGPGFVNQTESAEQTIKNEHAKEFMEMSKQSIGLDLQKKKQETSEFMSPEAAMMRAKEIKFKNAEYDAKLEKLAPETARDIKKAQEELRTLGPDADLKIAQAQSLVKDLANKPIQKFFAAASDFGNAMSLSKADPLTKASAYKDFIDSFKAQNKDVTIPPNMEVWSENTDKYLKLAHLGSLYSVAHQQEIDKENVKGEYKLKGDRITSGGTVAAAKYTADEATKRAEMGLPSKEQQNDVRVQTAFNSEVKEDPYIKNILVDGYSDKTDEQRAITESRIDARKKTIWNKLQERMGGATSPNPDSPKPLGWDDVKEKRLQELKAKLGKN